MPFPASPTSAAGFKAHVFRVARPARSYLRLAYSSVHDGRPEEAALCLLNDLLVHRLRRVVHDDRALLVVDLGIDACVADQVDDPLLALRLREVEAGGEVPVSR